MIVCRWAHEDKAAANMALAASRAAAAWEWCVDAPGKRSVDVKAA